jgi:hypothetical protein
MSRNLAHLEAVAARGEESDVEQALGRFRGAEQVEAAKKAATVALAAERWPNLAYIAGFLEDSTTYARTGGSANDVDADADTADADVAIDVDGIDADAAAAADAIADNDELVEDYASLAANIIHSVDGGCGMCEAASAAAAIAAAAEEPGVTDSDRADTATATDDDLKIEVTETLSDDDDDPPFVGVGALADAPLLPNIASALNGATAADTDDRDSDFDIMTQFVQ